MHRIALILGILAISPSLLRADEPDDVRFQRALTKTVAAAKQLEFTQMFAMLATKGANMGPGDGWFKPSESRYSWQWLAERYAPDKDGRIARKQFDTQADLFARLDRDRDGVITAADLEWSDSSPFQRQMGQAKQWLQLVNDDGKLTRDEWAKLFDKLAQGKDYLNAEDARALLNPPRKTGPGGKAGGGMPSKATLLQGLIEGELGSMCEGPRLGQRAPDFTLVSHDEKRTVTLSKFRNEKPVVLIFGSFT